MKGLLVVLSLLAIEQEVPKLAILEGIVILIIDHARIFAFGLLLWALCSKTS